MKESRICFGCGKEITKFETNVGKSIHPEHDIWNNAVVDILSAGFGSKFDGNVYIIALCDDCIEKNIKRLDFRFKCG
jgi:hypothetical protein